MLALSTGTAAADTPSTSPTQVLEDLAELGAELLPSTPQSPAPPAEGDGTAESQRTAGPLDGIPLDLGGQEPTDEPTVQEEQSEDVAAAYETPDPLATLCGGVEGGLGQLPAELAPLTGPLADVLDQLCTVGGQLTEELEAALGDLQDLLTDLLALLADPAAGCEALIDLIEQGGAALGLPAEVLTGLIAKLCSFLPGEEPAPQPQPQPHPQPAAQPVVHPQAPQHPQPVAAPAANQAAPSGQLAYTGSEPTPYLAGGLIALGLGTGLTLLGRRRVESDA